MTTETEPLPKIFIGYDKVPAAWAPDLSGYAKDELGAMLGGHICSNESFVMSDLQRPHHQRHYAARFPGGYQLIWERTGEVLDTIDADRAAQLMAVAYGG